MPKFFLSFIALLFFAFGCITTKETRENASLSSFETKDYFQWTLVVIPDTQHYSQNQSKAPHWHMLKGFEWIADNKERLNIQMVQGLGDITQNWDNSTEWGRAADAWYKLEGIVGWMPNVGNHDSPRKFNQIFPIELFKKNDHFGGDFNCQTENSYSLLDIGKEKYLFLNIETYDQYSNFNQAPIDWANRIIAKYGDRKVILATHDNWETHHIRNKILSKHHNIVLTNAGHSCVREEFFRLNNSYNFIVDYQCDDYEVMKLRYYVFKPALDEVCFYTYSPVTNDYERDHNSEGCFYLKQKS